MGYNYDFITPISTENSHRATHFNYNYVNYKHPLHCFCLTYNLECLEAFFFSVIQLCSAIQNAYCSSSPVYDHRCYADQGDNLALISSLSMANDSSLCVNCVVIATSYEEVADTSEMGSMAVIISMTVNRYDTLLVTGQTFAFIWQEAAVSVSMAYCLTQP